LGTKFGVVCDTRACCRPLRTFLHPGRLPPRLCHLAPHSTAPSCADDEYDCAEDAAAAAEDGSDGDMEDDDNRAVGRKTGSRASSGVGRNKRAKTESDPLAGVAATAPTAPSAPPVPAKRLALKAAPAKTSACSACPEGWRFWWVGVMGRVARKQGTTFTRSHSLHAQVAQLPHNW